MLVLTLLSGMSRRRGAIFDGMAAADFKILSTIYIIYVTMSRCNCPDDTLCYLLAH